MKSYLRLPTSSKGFTLIELLVVIGILAILLAIVIAAINPARQFSRANNTSRSNDVREVLNAINQYMAENNGTLPSGLSAGISGELSTADIDICSDLVPQYLAALPVDPQATNNDPVTDCAVAYDSDYTASVSASNNRITLTAPSAELGESISVTR